MLAGGLCNSLVSEPTVTDLHLRYSDLRTETIIRSWHSIDM